MKKVVYSSLIGLFLSLGLVSCDDDETAVVTDPTAISFSGTSGSVAEGETLSVTVSFAASPVAADFTVTLSGDAVYGTDYTTTPDGSSGSIAISIAEGDTQKTIEFVSIDNELAEGDKTVTMALSSDSPLVDAGNSTFTLTIEENELPIVLTRADIPIQDGFSIQRAEFTASSFTALPEGENQRWDLSALPASEPINIVPYEAFADSSVPGANFQIETVGTELITGTPLVVNSYYQLDETGYYYMGFSRTEPATVPIFEGQGELIFQAGTFLLDPKETELAFPLEYGNNKSQTTGLVEDFVVNYPAAGLDNVPANTVDSSERSYSVVGWGKMKLPGYSTEFEVLMVKNTYTTTRNYLLGGAPAPADLLTGLGLANGDILAGIEITFYTAQHGRIAWYRTSNGEVTEAFYRADIPE